MLLAEDHAALAEVLKQLQSALNNGDVEASHAKLDLFWARLAVHIRAEHLHLFPALVTHLSAARPTIEDLHADHDFFMTDLARAIGILRHLLYDTERSTIDEGIASVRNTIAAVAERLEKHNEVEETKVYLWATSVLNEEEQAALATQIEHELTNRPPRFSQSAWLNRRP